MATTAKGKAFEIAFREYSLKLGIDAKTSDALSACVVSIVEDGEKLQTDIAAVKADIVVLKAK